MKRASTMFCLFSLLSANLLAQNQESGQVLYRSGDPVLYQTQNDEARGTRRQLRKEMKRAKAEIQQDNEAIEKAEDKSDKKLRAQLQEDEEHLEQLKEELKMKKQKEIP